MTVLFGGKERQPKSFRNVQFESEAFPLSPEDESAALQALQALQVLAPQTLTCCSDRRDRARVWKILIVGCCASLCSCVCAWGMIYSQPRVNFFWCFWSWSKTVVSFKNSRIWLVRVWQSSAPACSTGQCGDVSFSEYLNVVFSAAYLCCCLKSVTLNALLFLVLSLMPSKSLFGVLQMSIAYCPGKSPAARLSLLRKAAWTVAFAYWESTVRLLGKVLHNIKR